MEKKKPTIVIKQIHDLIPNVKNPRTHDEAQVKLIAESIKKFGFSNPVLLDGANGVLAGHGRLMAARLLQLSEVPCIELGHLSPAEKKAYIIADNQITLRGGWDADLLAGNISEIKDMDADLIGLLGFSDDEMKAIENSGTDGKTDEDSVSEVQTKVVSMLDDVWIMGKHRVRCGDSTNAEAVQRLLNGAKPHLMVTDPPYGVNYDANWRNEAAAKGTIGQKHSTSAVGKVLNDDRADWSEAWALFPGHIAYVWHAGTKAGIVQKSLEDNKFKIRAQIIWAKDNFAISRGDYHIKHEPCWYAVKGTGKWCSDRSQTSLWEIPKPLKSETSHSTTKPVECMRRPMMNNSVKGDSVYDPFLGSGTTLIAAESEGRICFGMELSPAYVDVIVRRWEDFTGREAVLESSGETFSETKLKRIGVDAQDYEE